MNYIYSIKSILDFGFWILDFVSLPRVADNSATQLGRKHQIYEQYTYYLLLITCYLLLIT